jgi:putative MATE family efflux protein
VDDHRLTETPDPAPPTSYTAEPPRIDRDGAHPHEPALIDRPWPIWRLVLTLAWPELLRQLLVLSVSFSDRLLTGRFLNLGTEEHIAAQAAMTTANYLSWLITSYTILVSVGSTALVARFIGGRDRPAAVAVTHQSILLALFLGLLGSAAGLLALPDLIAILGLHGPAADAAIAFLRPLLVLLPFQVVESAGIACLVGAGDTRTGLWVLGSVAVLNLPLAWLFFFGLGPLPGLGFPGIAVGTAVSHTLGGLIVLVVLFRGRAGLVLRWDLFRPHFDLLRRLLRISVPAALDSLSVAVGQLWFVSLVNRLGDAASAAHGIALYWEALGYLSGAAFGVAAMTLVGQNLGAGRPHRAARSGWVAFALGCSVMTLMGATFFVLAEPMFRLFCPGPEQQPIVRAGVPVLRLVAFAMPALASCIIFTNALRGAGDTRVPVLFTWFGYFGVRIPLAYLLTATSLGLMGAWLAMSADLVIRGCFFLWRFAGGRWQHIRV